jgi:hypothetical protein
MGLFDRIKKSVEEGAKTLGGIAEAGAKKLGEIAETVADELEQAGAKPAQQPGAPQTAAPQQPATQHHAAPAGESGDSWGDEMPAEPNQFNFNGNYVQYFESILREEFAGYAVHTDASEMRRRTVFTLTGAAGKALVVEVMTENSEAQKIRRACEKEGVPYVRFYFDHDGWWNTRSYVTRRIRAALR